MSRLIVFLNAVRQGDMKLVQQCVQNMDKAEINLAFRYETGLSIAVCKNHIPMMEYLLSHGADPFQQLGPNNILVMAIQNNQFSLLRLLLDMGEDINVKYLIRSVEAMKMFLEKFPEKKAGLSSRSDLLMQAIRMDNDDMVRYLLEELNISSDGAVDPIDKRDVFPLGLAFQLAENENILKIVRMLLDHGADVHMMMPYNIPIHHLLRESDWGTTIPVERRINMMDLLFQKGFHDIDITDHEGQTVLSIACERKEENFIQYLLDHGANPRNIIPRILDRLQRSSDEKSKRILTAMNKTEDLRKAYYIKLYRHRMEYVNPSLDEEENPEFLYRFVRDMSKEFLDAFLQKEFQYLALNKLGHSFIINAMKPLHERSADLKKDQFRQNKLIECLELYFSNNVIRIFCETRMRVLPKELYVTLRNRKLDPFESVSKLHYLVYGLFQLYPPLSARRSTPQQQDFS